MGEGKGAILSFPVESLIPAGSSCHVVFATLKVFVFATIFVFATVSVFVTVSVYATVFVFENLYLYFCYAQVLDG